MPCLICKLRVERHQLKIQCEDCDQYFHCSCAKIKPSDMEFMKKTNNKFRCNSCNRKRRLSLRSPPLTTTDTASVLVQSELDSNSNSKKIIEPSQKKVDNLTTLQISLPSKHNIQDHQQNDMEENTKDSSQRSLIIANSGNQSMEQQHHDQLQHIVSEPTKILNKLELVYNEIINLKEMHSNNVLLIKSLQDEKVILKEKIDVLEKEVNYLHQKRRDKCIEIIGVPKVNDNNALNCAKKIFSDALNINITDDQIDNCFVKKIKKIDNFHSKNSYMDILCVKFVSLNCKKLVMKSKYSNKDKLTSRLFGCNVDVNNIYVNDSLSIFTRRLLKEAQALKKKKKIKFVWIRNGSVLIRKGDGDKVLVVNSLEDLSKFN